MYRSESINLDKLCEHYSLDAHNRIDVKNDLNLLLKKYLTQSERPGEIFDKIKLAQGPIGVCRVIWPNETVLFKCNDCQYDETCAICVGCFLNSSHANHSWSMSKSYGGCCDCGDTSSWKLSGSCHKHQGITPKQDGPKSVACFNRRFYARSIKLIGDMILFVDKYLLVNSSAQHKFSSFLLEILKDFANLLHGFRWIINQAIKLKTLHRWIKRYKDLDLSLQRSFGLFYLAMFASPKFKVKFSKMFVRNYLSIITPFPKLLYDNKAFSITELSVQLFTVPEIAISLSKAGFVLTCIWHLKKLFKSFTFSTITHNEFIVNGFLHECIQICADLSFLFNHKEVSQLVIEDKELHCELFNMLSSYNYVNSQVLHVEQHIEIQNTLYPLAFIIEDRIFYALRPLWINANKYKDQFGASLWAFYENYFKTIFADKEISDALQSRGTDNDIYLCRTFHIPLIRLLPYLVDIDNVKLFIDSRIGYNVTGGGERVNYDLEFDTLVRKSMVHVMTQCIRCHLFYLEIKNGMWVKNGDSMLSQNEKYKSMGLLDRDVAAMQLASLINSLLFNKSSLETNFVQILLKNTFPYWQNYSNLDELASKFSTPQCFTNAFDKYYFKFLNNSIRWFWIILARHLANVGQLISSTWDFNTPIPEDASNLSSKDGNDVEINLVKYLVFKMDLIHFIHTSSISITEVVKYIERKWPNGKLFRVLDEVGSIRRYENGNADVVLKSKYAGLIDIYWPGEFTIFEENVIAHQNNTNSSNLQVGDIFPAGYNALHEQITCLIYPQLVELLQSFSALPDKFTLPSFQLQIIRRVVSKFEPTLSCNQIKDLIDAFTRKTDVFDHSKSRAKALPKRSAQAEALLSLKRKQSEFLATLSDPLNLDKSDDKPHSGNSDEDIYCILCHSPGDLYLMCYQLPLLQSYKQLGIKNFYPLFRCIETCGHTIHQKCLDAYNANKRYLLKKSFPCPLCKLSVNFTLPFIGHNNVTSKSKKHASSSTINNAFVATYWELLINTSFKRNLLISNRATMLIQLMKHQYMNTVFTGGTANWPNQMVFTPGDTFFAHKSEYSIWNLNPVANLLQFMFTGMPNLDDILAHVQRLSYLVVLQLALDGYLIGDSECEMAVEETCDTFVAHFKLTKVLKNYLSFRMKANCNHSADGCVCGLWNVKKTNNRIKLSRSSSMKAVRVRKNGLEKESEDEEDELAKVPIDIRDFLSILEKILETITTPGSNITLLLAHLASSFGNKLIVKLNEFLAVSLWALHCVFPLKQHELKTVSHEHLISDQFERFSLLWNLVVNGKMLEDDFKSIVAVAIEQVNAVTSARFKPRFKLKMFKLARNSDSIPCDYMKLLRNTMKNKCILCRNKPSSPVVCLFCCEWICLYCREGDRFMGAFDHALMCSCGSGCFFLVHQRKVLYICSHTKRFAYVDSIYNGTFGTFRENLSSNSPLELSSSRLVAIANDLFFNRRSIKWQKIRPNLLDDESD